ncbi:MAG: hypothetical protein ACJAS3_000669 [Roseivirga sp.]|jgi:hypothetical protein
MRLNLARVLPWLEMYFQSDFPIDSVTDLSAIETSILHSYKDQAPLLGSLNDINGQFSIGVYP